MCAFRREEDLIGKADLGKQPKHPFYFGVLIAYSFLSLGQSALLVG